MLRSLQAGIGVIEFLIGLAMIAGYRRRAVGPSAPGRAAAFHNGGAPRDDGPQ